jgi:glycosyltransferase involved in cell wall biosynthesis
MAAGSIEPAYGRRAREPKPMSLQGTRSDRQRQLDAWNEPSGPASPRANLVRRVRLDGSGAVRWPNRLLVVSHVIHYRDGGQVHAYGPYAREIDIWADLFSEIVIAAPCRVEPPPGDCLPFRRPNITIAPQPEMQGVTWQARLRQAVTLPRVVSGLARAMWQADAIHVRCPGNLGLLGSIMAPLFSRRLVAKYAGQWNGYPGEGWSNRLQRFLLSAAWWRGPVTVYGQWPGQPPHIVPFFTSMMTAEQVEHATVVASSKRISGPLRILYTGRLADTKRVGVLLEAAKLLAEKAVGFQLSIVGDGPDIRQLRRSAELLGLSEAVRFVGAVPLDSVLPWYEWAHCLVLPSLHSEGWPKAIAEAMCHGLVCLAVDHGQVSSMLAGRGILLQAGTAEEIADSLESVAREPDRYRTIAINASLWARQYSLDGLRVALAELLHRHWDEAVGEGPRQVVSGVG